MHPGHHRQAARYQLTSESGPLSAPGHVNETYSWQRLWTTKLQTATTRNGKINGERGKNGKRGFRRRAHSICTEPTNLVPVCFDRRGTWRRRAGIGTKKEPWPVTTPRAEFKPPRGEIDQPTCPPSFSYMHVKNLSVLTKTERPFTLIRDSVCSYDTC